MSHVKKLFFLLIIQFMIMEGFGQSAASPFSTFGIGERYGNALTNNHGMGGVGVSQPQFWYANTVNPALLVFNNMTTFSAGILYEQRNISSDTVSQKTKGGNLNYIVLAFPVVRGKWSTAISLSPYSSVKYSLESAKPASGGSGVFDTYESGSGGISQLSWSNGVRLTESVLIGVRANYLFGSILSVYQSRLQGSTQPLNYYATVEERAYTKDFTFSAGVAFTQDSLFARNRYKLSFGAVYDFAANVTTRSTSLLYRTNVPGTKGTRIDEDTLAGFKSDVALPPGLTTGITFGTNKWLLSSEFSYYDWTAFNSFNPDDESGLGKSWRVAVGGETTPDTYSNNYLKRITYRAGFAFEELPYTAGNKKVNDLGMTLGLSLPAGRSSLDLALKYGKRGSVSDNNFGENYFRVFFGITVNDNWFIKRKFE